MKAIVTRPRDDAAALVGALADRGVAALLAPMLTILPVPQATRHLAERLAGAQAVLFTSANGVRAFAAASPRRELPVLAVGDASAAAARIAGFRSVASAGGDIEDLVELVAAHLSPQGGALVHAAGTTAISRESWARGASPSIARPSTRPSRPPRSIPIRPRRCAAARPRRRFFSLPGRRPPLLGLPRPPGWGMPAAPWRRSP